MNLGLHFYNLDNYGDKPANMYLMPKLFTFGGIPTTHKVVGLGSILFGTLSKIKEPLIICGTGYQYSSPYKVQSKDIVLFVRGEYTCENIGIDKRHACGDAILQLTFDRPEQRFDECTVFKHDHKPSYKAHVFTANTSDFAGFTRTILQYRRIVSDAFHVAAVADLFGIPWRPLRWEPKWAEHFRILGISEMPKDFTLSDRGTLRQVIEEQARRIRDYMVC